MEKRTCSDLGDKMAIQSTNWYGWGSPIGLGFALISVGTFLWLLHLAGLI